MPSKANEIVSNPHGDPRQCPICNPRRDRVREDQVWAWSKAHPGESVWR